MSLLTKWNPLHKSNEIDVWRPASRWDPTGEMEDVMRGLQRALTNWQSGGSDESISLSQWSPSVDIGENDQEFVIKVELPDVKKEDIKVNVENGTISICGERKVEKEEDNTKFHRVERAYGRFERTFSLPTEAQADKITSNYKDGVLTVHLPKDPERKPTSQTIPVQ